MKGNGDHKAVVDTQMEREANWLLVTNYFVRETNIVAAFRLALIQIGIACMIFAGMCRNSHLPPKR